MIQLKPDVAGYIESMMTVEKDVSSETVSYGRLYNNY